MIPKAKEIKSASYDGGAPWVSSGDGSGLFGGGGFSGILSPLPGIGCPADQSAVFIKVTDGKWVADSFLERVSEQTAF